MLDCISHNAVPVKSQFISFLAIFALNGSKTFGKRVKLSMMSEGEGQTGLVVMSNARHEATQAAAMPPWMRELGTRPSRASSIVSTRTRFSTTTLQEDARSIDIEVGGQYFRISRDGSRITDAPPPYSGPPLDFAAQTDGSRHLLEFSTFGTGGTIDDQNHEGISTPRSRSVAAISHTDIRTNTLDASEVDIPSLVNVPSVENQISSTSFNTSQDQIESEITPSRNPSYRTGPEIISVPYEARRSRTVSQNDVSRFSEMHRHTQTPLRRRNGVRLPSLITNSNVTGFAIGGHGNRLAVSTPFSSPDSPLRIRSAGPILSTVEDMERPRSPNFIGRGARGIFPTSKRGTSRQMNEGTYLTPNINPYMTTTADPMVIPAHEVVDDNITPPTMDNENDISLHYARIIRRLDQDHRRALHAKDKELAGYRERLHEIDTVYRQELKARDFIIDDLRKRLEHQQENTEALIEKARNQVEDLWESRWKDRDFHLSEHMKRMEEDVQNKFGAIHLERA